MLTGCLEFEVEGFCVASALTIVNKLCSKQEYAHTKDCFFGVARMRRADQIEM